MNCCYAALAVMVIGMLAPLMADDDDESWSPEDAKLVAQVSDISDPQKLDSIEKLCRILIEHHPHSCVALVFHIRVLDAMGRYPEALAESQKAVAFDPENFRAQEWKGIFLCRASRFSEAIPSLENSLRNDPGEVSTSMWLAQAYLKIGDKNRADAIHAALLKDVFGDELPGRLSLIGTCYREIGDSQSAILYWKKAAHLGDKYGARCLWWAYATGYGVAQDDGSVDYWKRLAGDTCPWFPRLPFAEALMNAAHGWGLVAIALLAAAVFPWLTISGVAYFMARSVTNNPEIHWTERARRSYPFQLFLGTCGLVLPLTHLAAVMSYPSFALPIPNWLFIGSVWAVGMLVCNALVSYWERRYRSVPLTFVQNLLNTVALLYLYAVVLVIFCVMGRFLYFQLDLQAMLVVAAGILAYFWIQFGGWIRLGRYVGLLIPADPKLVAMARDLARKRGHPEPTVWLLRWQRANAFAFTFSNAIAVTEKLQVVLNDDEMKAVLAHELGHLCEDRSTRLIRLLCPLLLVPLFMTDPLQPLVGWTGILAFYVLCLLGFGLRQRLAQRMEVRADSFGNEAQKADGVYARALEKLYEANLVPAVLPGKRKVHPHLYDRLLAAGVTPAYPRPQPPARWGGALAILVLGVNATILSIIWLLIF